MLKLHKTNSVLYYVFYLFLFLSVHINYKSVFSFSTKTRVPNSIKIRTTDKISSFLTRFWNKVPFLFVHSHVLKIKKLDSPWCLLLVHTYLTLKGWGSPRHQNRALRRHHEAAAFRIIRHQSNRCRNNEFVRTFSRRQRPIARLLQTKLLFCKETLEISNTDQWNVDSKQLYSPRIRLISCTIVVN